MSKLSTYLAQHYLTPTSTSKSLPDADSRPKKRRKKDKHPTSSSSGLVIADDDDLLLSSTTNRTGGDDNEDSTPLMYEATTKSAEFRKKNNSTWNTIASGVDEQSTNGRGDANAAGNGAIETRNENEDNEDAEANRILSEAATAQAQRRQDLEMEDAPAIVDAPPSNDDNDTAPKMSSGVRAGLQTAADTQALIEKETQEKEAERRKEKRHKSQSQSKRTEEEDQTIYRDASGRVINLSTRRAELLAQQREKELAKRKEREDAMGEVQRRQKAERQQELEEAKFLTLGRGEDDEEMNSMLKKQMRWDDPMAGYIAETSAETGALAETEGRNGRDGASNALATAAANSKPGRAKKIYQGAAPPNRYGILPGHRWDGVDRGNGFEKDWFQARSRTKRNTELSYQWQMDE